MLLHRAEYTAVPPIFARDTRASLPLNAGYGSAWSSVRRAAGGGIPRASFRGAFSLRRPLSAGTISCASLPLDCLYLYYRRLKCACQTILTGFVRQCGQGGNRPFPPYTWGSVISGTSSP